MKAIAFDLDSTLAESKQPLSPEMGALLARLLSLMPVAIMSGAAFAQYQTQFFPAFLEHTHFENLFIFPDNAAQCFVFKDGAWQARYDESFSQEERDRILRVLNEAIAETKINDLVPQTWGPQIEDRGAQISFSALGQQAPVEVKKMWDPMREKRQRLHAVLVKLLPEFSEAIGGLTTIDITRKGINKAYGVRQFSELTNIPIADMLYVGDALEPGGNDAVVIPTGIPTHQVAGPEDTREVIEKILSTSEQKI